VPRKAIQAMRARKNPESATALAAQGPIEEKSIYLL
jgi:hypothetical protein